MTALSNPAKILLAYMRLTNRWDSRELAAEFDVPLRTIQRWKMECATSATDAISGVPSVNEHNATRATGGVSGAPAAPDMALAQELHSCAGANKESPTEISYSSSLVDAPQANVLPFAEPVSKQRGSRLPETWELPDDWRQWAEINTQLGRDGIALEADKFRDFWIAQPGVKGRKVNWPATWRNWCRSAGTRKPYSPGRMSYDERKPEPKFNVFDQLRAEGYR